MKNLSFIFIFFALSLASPPIGFGDEFAFKESLYALKEGASFKEVTSIILAQKNLPPFAKQKFIQQKRRFFVFSYPSDGLKVKSMISFVENTQNQPLLFILRGNSRMEALPAFLYPEKGVLFSIESDATVICACYRDGVSEGRDEYGGADVNDVYNLTLYLPTVFKELTIEVDEKKRYMIGLSRGGMQMFLALAKFPQLQSFFHKFVSFSGLLDIDHFASQNPSWCQKMERYSGFDGSQGWLDQRNAILALPKIPNKGLPFLLIQGTADQRVGLDEGYSMLQTMRAHQFTNISYWEVEGGDHVLKNHPEYIKLILTWLLSE